MIPVLALWLQVQATLVLQPDPITRCVEEGIGRATVAWTNAGAGPVEVRVEGAPMTGLEAPNGSAETGDWVRDGMTFVLVDAAGRELARATAHVACAAAGDTYFPLRVGNEWVYRINSRVVTSTYAIRRVSRTESIGGRNWFVVTQAPAENQANAGETRYRADERGRIYRLNARGEEQLWLDPTDPPDPASVLRVESRGFPVRTALGAFPDALRYRLQEALALEFGTLVRGLGLLESSSSMLSGSSGGFLESLELVSARIGDNLVFAAPAVSLQLSAEAAEFNVTGRQVTNCAVPCYFVACGLVPGADPPNTFKPCFQARVQLEDRRPAAARSVELELLDAGGRAIVRGTHELAPRAGRPEWLLLRQVPLYTAPNEPVPPGDYRLRATGETATAELPIRVR